MEEKFENNSAAPEKEAEQKSGSVFRSSSLERISSPEQLNDYIRVASPRLWVVLLGLTAFLVGALIWSRFGSIGSTVYGVAIVENGDCTLYVTQEKAAYLEPGNPVTIENCATELISLSPEPFAVTESMSEYARNVGNFSLGEWVIAAEVKEVTLSNGVYAASVEEERLSALSLLTDLR